MADFDDEIDEELRRAKLRAAWDRYGIYGIVAAVIVIGVVGVQSTLDYFKTKDQLEQGQLLLRGERSEQADENENALKPYTYLRENANDTAFGLLGSFREAAILGKLGRTEEQKAVYDEITAMPLSSGAWDEMARFFKVWGDIDGLSAEELLTQLTPYLSEDNALYTLALEAMILKHYGDGEPDLALGYVEKLDALDDDKWPKPAFNYSEMIAGGEVEVVEQAVLDQRAKEKAEAYEKARAEATARIEAQKEAEAQSLAAAAAAAAATAAEEAAQASERTTEAAETAVEGTTEAAETAVEGTTEAAETAVEEAADSAQSAVEETNDTPTTIVTEPDDSGGQ